MILGECIVANIFAYDLHLDLNFFLTPLACRCDTFLLFIHSNGDQACAVTAGSVRGTIGSNSW